MPNIPNYPPQGIQAQLDLLYLYNPDVANALTAKLDAGLIQLEELQQQVDAALKDLQGVLRYKGSVATEADLPTEGNTIGDVWNVLDTDKNYAWDGTKWDEFGAGIDTSAFLTTTDASKTYLKQTAVSNTVLSGYNPSKTDVPSLALLNKYVAAPTWFEQEIYVKPTEKIYIRGLLPQSNSGETNGVSFILFLSRGDLYNGGNAVMAIRVTCSGYTYGNTNNWVVEKLYNTLGEDVSLGFLANTDIPALYPTSGNWKRTSYEVGLLYLTNSNGYFNGFSLQKTTSTIEEVIPYKQSVLPSQTDNAGKFLTTDGTNASWAAIQQASGGSIVWDKEFTASKAQINGDNDNRYCGLKFTLPEGLADGEYEFTYCATGLPNHVYDTTDVWTYKLFLVRIIVQDGAFVNGIAWHAFSPEYGAALTGNNPINGNTQLFLVNTDGSFLTGFNGYTAISEIGEYAYNTDAIYDTLKITKLKNTDTGELYELQNVQQTFEYTPDYSGSIALNLFADMQNIDYSTQLYACDFSGVKGNTFWINGLANPFFLPKVDLYWGGYQPNKKMRLVAWSSSVAAVLVMEIDITPQKLTATVVQATGAFKDTYTVYVFNDVQNSTVPICIRMDSRNMPNNCFVTLSWVGNSGGQPLDIVASEWDIEEDYTAIEAQFAAEPATEAWAQNTFINADASMYTLATLQDAFNYSNARLYKIFNEAKMPTTDTYTLFSLGWTYTDSENIPTLIASNAANGKLYYYHGTYDNCEPATWQEFNFGEGGGDYLPLSGGTLTGTLGVSTINNGTDLTVPTTGTALATIEDVMEHSELPSQEDNAGKVLTTDGTTVSWTEPTGGAKITLTTFGD